MCGISSLPLPHPSTAQLPPPPPPQNRRGAEKAEPSGDLASLNLEPALSRASGLGPGLPHSASTPSFASFSPGRAAFVSRRDHQLNGSPPDAAKNAENGSETAPLFQVRWVR